MATPPVEAIPTWATSGTGIARTVDPTAGVRADGWDEDQQPPAGWWNWMWNVCGKWLTYLDTLGTEHELRITNEEAASSSIFENLRETARNTTMVLWSGVTSGYNEFVDLKTGLNALGSGRAGAVWLGDNDDNSIYFLASHDGGSSFASVALNTGALSVRCLAETALGEWLCFDASTGVYLVTITGSGETITLGSSVETSTPQQVFWADGDRVGEIVIAIHTTSARVYRSNDKGSTWSTPGHPLGGTNRGIQWLPDVGLWVLCSSTGYATSPTGVTWTDRTGVLPANVTPYAFIQYISAGKFYMYGWNSSTSRVVIYENTSLTSGTWTLLFTSGAGVFQPTFVSASGPTGGLVFRSDEDMVTSHVGTSGSWRRAQKKAPANTYPRGGYLSSAGRHFWAMSGNQDAYIEANCIQAG